MKFKVMSLVLSIFYLPFTLYFYYKILEHIKATELLWFMYWINLVLAFLFTILSELARWED